MRLQNNPPWDVLLFASRLMSNVQIGAISVDKVYEKNFGIQAEEDLRLLIVVSELISQTVQRVQKINEEKRILEQENSMLRTR